ncbi:peptidoglycan-associated lipoprotein [Oryzisolibacter propanilivorax]|uniref:Peptidoglycan-associated lipoprotein n=1 Tax=Oryzisolibacter propanilivorax TaxID=1527607 RepID=A0A1G9SMM4_9BURK|nr:peptidoglycan-associated lipoprotein Pal [Oryzisolibacter propanilivorax]SDM36689.1 peptidoglycan-associated lipoprotein [Oryzisolibacter propanilivorax]
MIAFPLKRVSAAFAIAALVAGCSSGVKLDDVPVEDRGAMSTAPNPGANSGSMGQSGVAPVDLSQSAQNAGGPVGVERIVYFDFDSFVVKPEYQSLLEGHARYLKAAPARKVMIEGHTDERGGREYNLALGQKRAEAVRRSLALLGVGDAQMEAVSFGKEKPAISGHGEDAHSQNRRAELTYR